jgi:chromate transport protein ChrA
MMNVPVTDASLVTFVRYRIADAAPSEHGVLATRLATTLGGLVALVAFVMSAAIIWLCLTEPLTVADAVRDGQVTALVRVVAGVVVSMLEQVVRYL